MFKHIKANDHYLTNVKLVPSDCKKLSQIMRKNYSFIIEKCTKDRHIQCMEEETQMAYK